MLKHLQKYSPVLLRIGIGLVFLWFGINQIVNTANFLGYLPSSLFASPYASKFVIANGIFEIVFSLLLLIGLFTRFIAFMLGVHLLFIALGLGYSETAVRDLGLTIAAFSIFLAGDDLWCLDCRRRAKNAKK